MAEPDTHEPDEQAGRGWRLNLRRWAGGDGDPAGRTPRAPADDHPGGPRVATSRSGMPGPLDYPGVGNLPSPTSYARPAHRTGPGRPDDGPRTIAFPVVGTDTGAIPIVRPFISDFPAPGPTLASGPASGTPSSDDIGSEGAGRGPDDVVEDAPVTAAFPAYRPEPTRDDSDADEASAPPSPSTSTEGVTSAASTTSAAGTAEPTTSRLGPTEGTPSAPAAGPDADDAITTTFPAYRPGSAAAAVASGSGAPAPTSGHDRPVSSDLPRDSLDNDPEPDPPTPPFGLAELPRRLPPPPFGGTPAWPSARPEPSGPRSAPPPTPDSWRPPSPADLRLPRRPAATAGPGHATPGPAPGGPAAGLARATSPGAVRAALSTPTTGSPSPGTPRPPSAGPSAGASSSGRLFSDDLSPDGLSSDGLSSDGLSTGARSALPVRDPLSATTVSLRAVPTRTVSLRSVGTDTSPTPGALAGGIAPDVGVFPYGDVTAPSGPSSAAATAARPAQRPDRPRQPADDASATPAADQHATATSTRPVENASTSAAVDIPADDATSPASGRPDETATAESHVDAATTDPGAPSSDRTSPDTQTDQPKHPGPAGRSTTPARPRTARPRPSNSAFAKAPTFSDVVLAYVPPHPAPIVPVHPSSARPARPSLPITPPAAAPPPPERPAARRYSRPAPPPPDPDWQSRRQVSAEEITHENVVEPDEAAPRRGWRARLFSMTGGRVNPGVGHEEQAYLDLLDRVRRPVKGARQIAVSSIKGGVGKTTVSACLGLVLSEHRGDGVIAVDADPDAGNLADRLTGQSDVTVRHLLSDLEAIRSLSDFGLYTSLTRRLRVLAGDQHPAVGDAFRREEYERVCDTLTRYFDIVITDSGTGLVHDAMRGILTRSDRLIVVGSLTVDGASRASKTLDWLLAHGHERLADDAVVVLSADRGSAKVNSGSLRSHFRRRSQHVIEIPPDPHLYAGGLIDLTRLAPATQRAYLELGAVIADGFEDELFTFAGQR